MKQLLIYCLPLIMISCSNHSSDYQAMQAKIDSLQKQVNKSYKPGLGEFMSAIQVHHAKLWFAGTNQNWKLADFEIHEIMEAIDDIQQYCTDRPESKEVVMLQPAIDSLNKTIASKNKLAFKSSFIFLTQTCNNCHKEVHYNFNEVVIPTTPPFSNQLFTTPKP
ncbi:MAG: hypothetical protein EKK39_01080 [Sphingobacteriales bacterium]|uniref:hypothetical protein n=1 Tax=Hydrotalea flava TaxID=714549 RepID=UPI000FA224C0|nr:hypothetical protein [Hydrotalea flava]RTL56693.1 MAG: hypothetical protein EKK39_01080 [Sphingobacteriales bacterium]